MKRSVLKANIIYGLRCLASYDLQKTSWFENDYGLCSAYAEDVEAVFTDTGLEDALDAGEVVFGKEADDALRELDRACDAIGYDRDERELIDSIEMKILRQMARNCLNLVRESDGSESTVNLLDVSLVKTNIRFADMPE